MAKAKISTKPIMTSKDFLKGYTAAKRPSDYANFSPWQMIPLEDKTEEWFKWNMDWFEQAGISQTSKEKRKIIKNRMMAAGILDNNDYIPGSENSEIVDITANGKINPLQMFYPLAPSAVNVLSGEFLKKDNKPQIECVDKFTVNDKLEYKQSLINDVVKQRGLQLKEQALQKMGVLSMDEQGQQNPEFVQQMKLQEQIEEANNKFKNYRHTMELWGQHVFNQDYARFYIDEVEAEAFKETLCNSKAFFHIDLLESDYTFEFLDNADCFWHKSKNVKYVSEGDYFGWFAEMTAGDIVNKIGSRLKQEHFESIKKVLDSSLSTYSGTAWLTDDQKMFPNTYYDATKAYPDGRKNIPMQQHYDREEIKDFIKSNFENYSTDQMLNAFGEAEGIMGKPKLFRVMRLYWRSQKKIGWLTKKDKDGTVLPGTWIDENFKVTEEPVYSFELNKNKSAENLVYGEHIDWEWRNEWRHGMKISLNVNTKFVQNQSPDFNPIYIDGEPVKFQFKGKDNNMQCYPPVEGCEFKLKGLRPVSFIDLLTPYNIAYNICENRVTQVMAHDWGKLLYHNQATINRNQIGGAVDQDRLDAFYDMVKSSKVLPGHIDKEIMNAIGQGAGQTPQIIDMSIIKDAVDYKVLGRMIKEDALETIGITRARLGQSKPNETATGVEAGVSYSESQTEAYFNQFSNELMPRVYQRLLEAAQYYHYINKSTKISYRDNEESNVMLDIEDMDGLLRDFLVRSTNKPRMKVITQKLEQLFLNDNTLEATALDRAEMIYSDSATEKMEKIRKSQIKKERLEQERYDREMEQQEKQDALLAEMQEKELAFKSNENQLDRESKERIAELKALSGLQTDVDANSVPDAQDNMNYLLKRRQLEGTESLNTDKLDFEKRKHSDTMALKQKELMSKANSDQKKLAVALVNGQKNDDKKLNSKISKKQGVSK